MKKAITAALGAALFLAVSSLTLSGQEQVVFKITGGLTFIQGDDYNRGILGTNQILGATSESLVGGYKKLKSGRNLQLAIINYWGRHLGIGLGGGYCEIHNESGVSGKALGPEGEYTFASTYLPKISAIPFFLNVYYKTQPAARLGLEVFAGPVFQVIQFGFTRQATSSLNPHSEIETFKASGVSLGFQGGITANFCLFRGIGLVVEGLYRKATISNLHGNWLLTSTTDSGTNTSSSSAYYFWSFDYAQVSSYPQVGFFDANGPSGDGISNVRKARLNLSGLTATVGIRLSL